MGGTAAIDGVGRWRALGMVAGPVAFVTAWAVGGKRMAGYSPVHDAISRIAAVGAPERGLMTAGFVGYGAAVLVAAPVLRRSAIGRAWPALAANGLATWAVAALPLDRSEGVDLAHGVAATIGYVSLALVPALAAGPLTDAGYRRAGRVSWVVTAAVGACLAATVVADAKGLAQRSGLTLGDGYLAALGLALAAGRLRRGAGAGDGLSERASCT